MRAPVVALLEVLAGDPEERPRRFDALVAVARGRLADPAFGIADLAEAFAVTVRTVQWAFQAEGTTFGAWLLAERLELARGRLGAAGWRQRSIGEIAGASGFRSTPHFHRAYRERFGTTPGAARAS